MGLLSILIFKLPAHCSEPDEDALALLDELQLNQTSAPIRESANWKNPEKVVVYLPENRKPDKARLLNDKPMIIARVTQLQEKVPKPTTDEWYLLHASMISHWHWL